ncbi:MAG: (2Fe-2S)-binding protein [Planctomycetota bacterium]|nr:MAG: (2Fe-2S)-binding protein [Planctomycetota bacterium]
MSEERLRVSRREVLKGAAGAAAWLGVPAAARAEGEERAPSWPGIRRLGPGPTPLSFRLNGEAVTIEVTPRTTLLDALRGPLGLTGAKRACDRGACGACTVWIDGRTANACTVLALDVDGLAVTTVEGLSSGNALHPVQEAFVAQDALMCGFCTPGMVMSCAKLVERGAVDEESLREGLSGNLCRCGAYPHIFRACQEAQR